MTELLKIALELIKEIGYIPTLFLILISFLLLVSLYLIQQRKSLLQELKSNQLKTAQDFSQKAADAIIDIKRISGQNLEATNRLDGQIQGMKETIDKMLETILKRGE